jgi:hypothetical protein
MTSPTQPHIPADAPTHAEPASPQGTFTYARHLPTRGRAPSAVLAKAVPCRRSAPIMPMRLVPRNIPAESGLAGNTASLRGGYS